MYVPILFCVSSVLSTSVFGYLLLVYVICSLVIGFLFCGICYVLLALCSLFVALCSLLVVKMHSVLCSVFVVMCYQLLVVGIAVIGY